MTRHLIRNLSFLIILTLLVTSATASPPALASVTTVAKSRGYKIHVTVDEVKVGQASSFHVTVEAKEGYQICQKFAHSLSLNAPAHGISLTQTRLKARAFDKNKSILFRGTRQLTFIVRFEATKRGQFELPASLRLSVQNSTEVLTKKRKFTINLKVD